jgi:hypothetical protein
MAKYRITSIPQFKNGGEKKRKKKTVAQSNWNSPVNNFTPSSVLSAFMPNEPIAQQPDQYVLDPTYNNLNKNVDSEVDRLFNKIVLPGKDNLESCPPGYTMYKGECVDAITYNRLTGKELDYNYYSVTKEIQDREAKKKSDRESRIQKQQEKQKEYADKIFKLKKSDKVEPFESYTFEDFDKLVPVLDENNKPIIDEETGKPKTQTLADFAKQNYLVIKNDTDNSVGKKGTYSVFPQDIVADRIIHNGFQPLQFKTLWGFNDDQVKQVEEQFGPVMILAKQSFDSEMQKQIFDKARKENISLEEAAKKLRSDKTGNLSGYVQPIKDYLNNTIEELKSNTTTTDNEPLQSMYYDNRNPNQEYSPKVNWNSNNPNLEYNLDYYNTTGNWGKFLKDYSDYSKNLESKIGSNFLFKTDNGKNKDIALPISDRTSDLRNQLTDINENILLNQQIKTLPKLQRKALDETIYKDFNNQRLKEFSEATQGIENQLLDRKFNAAKNSPKAFSEILSDLVEGNSLLSPEEIDNASSLALLSLTNKNKDQIKQDMFPRLKLDTGEKIWDVLSNLERAGYAAGRAFGNRGSFSQNMWGNGTPRMTNNEWSELARKDPNLAAQLEQRDWLNYGPTSFLGDFADAVNPFNWTDELYRGFQENGFSGLRDRTQERLVDLGNKASFFIPAGAPLKALEAFNLSKQGLGTAYNAYKLAQGANKIKAAANLVMPAATTAFSGLNYGLNKLGLPGQLATNYFDRQVPAINFHLATKTLPEGISDISKGDIASGALNLGQAALFLTPAIRNINKRLPRIEYQTPSGKTIGIGTNNVPNLQFAKTPEEWLASYKLNSIKNAKNLGLPEEELIGLEKAINEGEILGTYNTEGLSFPRPQSQEELFKRLSFNPETLEMGLYQEPRKLFNFGPGQFQTGSKFTPLTFDKFVPRVPKYWTEDPAGLLGYEYGGQLPKAQPGGLIGTASKLSKSFKPLSTIVSTLRSIPSAGFSKAAIDQMLFDQAFQGLSSAIYKNPEIQSMMDMMSASLSNKDAQYLLSDYLNNSTDSADAYEKLNEALEASQPTTETGEFDWENFGDFNQNTIDFARRRHAAGLLKELGYVGQDVNDQDLYKMAASEEAINKVMQNAITHDRTGYRQVEGKFNPTGTYLGGNDPMKRQYNMFRPLYPNISEVENMLLKNVDRSNPLSLAPYQATHIPMEPYGYRAGVEPTSEYDALYLSSVPVKQDYGPYQFKIQRPLDFSTGNWKDWLEKYIYGKKTYTKDLKGNRKAFNPLEVYDDVGYNQGKKNTFNTELGIPTGSGMHTRYWYSGLGNEAGVIDPDFPFMDLQNMSAEDYMEMERYKQGIIDKYNTGWRGEYKKGGMPMKLSKSEINKYIEDGYIIEDE